MDEAEKLCDTIAIVDHGLRIALGTPRELIASLGGTQVVDFAVDGTLDTAALEALPSVSTVRAEADGYVVTTARLHEVLPPLLDFIEAAGTPLTRLSTHRATLEDVFVHLTGRQLRE
jgi:ABC-2 type transport system ATP-binding protein